MLERLLVYVVGELCKFAYLSDSLSLFLVFGSEEENSREKKAAFRDPRRWIMEASGKNTVICCYGGGV